MVQEVNVLFGSRFMGGAFGAGVAPQSQPAPPTTPEAMQMLADYSHAAGPDYGADYDGGYGDTAPSAESAEEEALSPFAPPPASSHFVEVEFTPTFEDETWDAEDDEESASVLRDSPQWSHNRQQGPRPVTPPTTAPAPANQRHHPPPPPPPPSHPHPRARPSTTTRNARPPPPLPSVVPRPRSHFAHLRGGPHTTRKEPPAPQINVSERLCTPLGVPPPPRPTSTRKAAPTTQRRGRPSNAYDAWEAEARRGARACGREEERAATSRTSRRPDIQC